MFFVFKLVKQIIELLSIVWTFWSLQLSNFWKFQLLEFGNLEVWNFGSSNFPNFWRFGLLEIWTFGILDVRPVPKWTKFKFDLACWIKVSI